MEGKRKRKGKSTNPNDFVGSYSGSYTDGSWNDGTVSFELLANMTYTCSYYYVYARDHGGDTHNSSGTWWYMEH